MIKAVFFDFDGVLTLDGFGSDSVINHVSEKTGIKPEEFREIYVSHLASYKLGKIKRAEFWSRVCRSAGRDIPISLLIDDHERVKINEGALNIVKRLKGKKRVCILTENVEERFEALKKRFGFEALFDRIFTSYKIGQLKATPETFKYIFKENGLIPEEAVFIDNNPKPLSVANLLGAKTILYKSTEHSLDYLIEELRKVGVDV